jgi:hypothetical protein
MSDPGNGLSVSGPGGFGLRATGRDVVLLLVLIAGFVGLGYVIDTRLTPLSMAQQEHAQLLGVNRDLVCMLALPTEVREAAARSGDVCRYLMLRSPDERRAR